MPAYLLEAFIVLAGIILLLLEAFVPQKDKSLTAWLAFGAVVGALVLLFFAKDPNPDLGNGVVVNAEMARFYAWDGSAKFFKGFALLATALTILMAIDFRKTLARYTANPNSEDGTGEYYSLLLFACAGLMWMASARDLVTLFVSLELTTITFYILVAYLRRSVGSLEAGVKYLILGALSTGFLVYGISWIYGATGSTSIEAIASASEHPYRLLFGLALILIALAFKIGAVPMHVWIPDVYQGAPTPTTAFLSVGSKAAGFAVTLRVLQPFIENPLTQKQALLILAVLACLTVLVGNLAAIPQNNFKRLLAYSSIANAGFILMAVAAWSAGSDSRLSTVEVVSFYLAVYLIMTFAAFFVLNVMQQATGSDEISAFNGLAGRDPLLAFGTTVILGALAGLPLTAGFWGKFFVFQAAVEAGLWWIVCLGFVGVAAGFYYYFKIIRAMYWRRTLDESKIEISPLSVYVLSVLVFLTLLLGFWADPILWLVS